MGWVHWLSALAGFKQRTCFGELFHSCSDRIKKTKELSSSILTTGRSCFPSSWHLDQHPYHDNHHNHQSSINHNHHNQLFCDDWNPGGMCSEHWGRRCKGELLIISVSTYSATRGLGMLVERVTKISLFIHNFLSQLSTTASITIFDHKIWQIQFSGVEIIASDKCQPPPRLHDVPGERWLPSHL